MSQAQYIADKAALQFYIDSGVSVALGDEAVDRFKVIETPPSLVPQTSEPSESPIQSAMKTSAPTLPIGKSEAAAQAAALAKSANTLEELREAIASFDGIAIKKTATNLVFADGDPKASIVLVGEAPGADDDRHGKPFAGISGDLLDKILGCIDLQRSGEDIQKSVYITNVLNWRPPGNRSPAPAEIEVSLPFIERHIQLIKPKILILCGGVAAKALLGSDESVSKIRRAGWHDYKPQTTELSQGAEAIPTIATYHPAYLLRTPAQKKAVWADMLELQAKYRTLLT